MERDITFIVSTFDSTLQFLDVIGSHEQWGSIPFYQRGDFSKEMLMGLQHSEEYRLTGRSNVNGLRIFIVGIEYPGESTEPCNGEIHSHLHVAADGRHYLPIGFAFTRENWAPASVKSQPHLQILEANLGDFLHLEAIVADTHVGSLRRGAGVALIRGIRDYGRSRQEKALLSLYLKKPNAAIEIQMRLWIIYSACFE
ncbi:hypothetical protein N7448_005054 [Penicillium atrosanguineum]|uniref:Uncharacterized protein n=1 Tax=Penicillium atrosanguineum TaxID=1132637 RepID=A0A9W9PP58_9EURO|nr:uncharacterized protein N7443_008784 [Penicillium atrosanguineum]KAJ5125739.1 hypothetical protein N7526_007916 [Penicillium atrosanguineum]KAJ5136500.1 hypothetical protein N7448_005054 [Penicillium atrosanguineum]KAJ5292831.1 hypothetical protein N7443_008784 [Penicillium atrosanguineum]KAJ5303131.1 hypothetical protein N7476_009930 [Penicillium atrosanguineum]